MCQESLSARWTSHKGLGHTNGSCSLLGVCTVKGAGPLGESEKPHLKVRRPTTVTNQVVLGTGVCKEMGQRA